VTRTRSKARGAHDPPAAVWRDGVHLVGTPLWCDADRRRDVCFVSSADRIASHRGQLIATPLTLALLGARDGGHLAVPVHRRFTLGTMRLELLPSGRGIGGAILFAEHGGRRVLYAGELRTAAVDGAELRVSDAVIVAAPYGEPHHVFPSAASVLDRLTVWLAAQLAVERRPVLVVDNILDGLELATRLVELDVPVIGSRRLREAAGRIAPLVPPPPLRAPAARAGRGAPGVLVRTVADPQPPAEAASISALVSGRALDGHAGHAAGFPWPNAADRAQLLGWIEQTRATQVFVTGPGADAIARTLGPRARTLGAPRQLSLWGA